MCQPPAQLSLRRCLSPATRQHRAAPAPPPVTRSGHAPVHPPRFAHDAVPANSRRRAGIPPSPRSTVQRSRWLAWRGAAPVQRSPGAAPAQSQRSAAQPLPAGPGLALHCPGAAQPRCSTSAAQPLASLALHLLHRSGAALASPAWRCTCYTSLALASSGAAAGELAWRCPYVLPARACPAGARPAPRPLPTTAAPPKGCRLFALLPPHHHHLHHQHHRHLHNLLCYVLKFSCTKFSTFESTNKFSYVA